jgi:hypothetical protein
MTSEHHKNEKHQHPESGEIPHSHSKQTGDSKRRDGSEDAVEQLWATIATADALPATTQPQQDGANARQDQEVGGMKAVERQLTE